MNALNLLAIAVFSTTLCSQVQVASNSFSYDHELETDEHEHTDEFKLSHKFDSGLKTAITLKFTPNDKKDGDAGTIFHDERWHETKLGISYPIKLTHNLKLEPGTSWSRKRGSYKYKPALKLKYSLTDDTKLAFGVRNEITDYSNDAKKTKRKTRYSLGLSHEFNRLEVKYAYQMYRSNKEIYNNRKTDYKHVLELSYQLTDAFSPFISIKDKSVDDDTDDRQQEYKVGFNYKF